VEEPEIIVAADKGPVAQEHNVTAHIDDYYPNCVDIKKACPDAYVALLYTPYNKIHHDEWKAQGGEIVLSVDHFIQECMKRELIKWKETSRNQRVAKLVTV